jgi:hypothetical protein
MQNREIPEYMLASRIAYNGIVSVVWRESVFEFHPHHYFQIIFKKHICDQSHESQTAGQDKW